MKLQSVNFYPKLGAYNVQFSANQGKHSLATIDREDFEDVDVEPRSFLNMITGNGYKYQEIGNGIAKYTAPCEKQWTDKIVNSVTAAVNDDGFLNGAEVGIKEDVKYLDKKFTVGDENHIREYLPVNNGSQERLGKGVGNFGPVYDYIVNEYDKTGETLLRSAYFKRVPKISKETNMAESVKYVLKRVEAYDRSEFTRIITMDDRDEGSVESVEFLRDGNRVGNMLFENNKIISFQDGNAYNAGNLLYNPTTFYFKNGALSEVEGKNVRYGFHTINKETYKYTDGEFAGFSDYKLSLRGGIETIKKYEMLDNVLVRTKKEIRTSEAY